MSARSTLTPLPGSAAGRPVRNPFPGPRPYRRDQHHLYPGRDTEKKRLLQAIIANRCLVLHGPSSAGKSSLLQAAVVPDLVSAMAFRVVSVDQWPPDRDGGAPLFLLRQIYRELSLGDLPTGQSHAELLDLALSLAEEQSDRPILIILDQMEQLLFPERSHDLFRQLLTLVDRTIDSVNQTLRVVLTLREDHLGLFRDRARNRRRLLESTFRLGPMLVGEITDAVCKAAKKAGQSWDSAEIGNLVGQIAQHESGEVDEADVEAAYVQIVCFQLFEQREVQAPGKWAPVRDPQTILGAYVAEALATFDDPDPARAELLKSRARDLLEEHLIDERGNRTLLTLGELSILVEDEEEQQRFLDHLEQKAVLRVSRAAGTPYIELGHDWLAKRVFQWKREREAREEDERRRRDEEAEREKAEEARRKEEEARQKAEQARRKEEEEARKREEAARREKLKRARQRTRAAKRRLQMRKKNAEAEAKAATAEQRRLEAERIQILAQKEAAELAEKVAKAAEKAAQASRRFYVVVAMIISVVIVSVGLGFFYWNKLTTEAEANLKIAAAKRDLEAEKSLRFLGETRMMAAAELLADGDPIQASKLLLEVPRPELAAGKWNALAIGALSQEMPLTTLDRHEDDVTTAVFSPDGTALVTGGKDKKAFVWDSSGRGNAAVISQDEAITGAVFSADSTSLAIATSTGVSVWSRTGTLMKPAITFPDGVAGVGFQGTSRLLVADRAGVVHVLEDGRRLVLHDARRKGEKRAVRGATFNASGTRGALLWEAGASNHAEAAVLDLTATPTTARAVTEENAQYFVRAAFSPDGARLALEPAAGPVRVRWVDNPAREPVTLGESARSLAAVRFVDDHKVLLMPRPVAALLEYDTDAGDGVLPPVRLGCTTEKSIAGGTMMRSPLRLAGYQGDKAWVRDIECRSVPKRILREGTGLAGARLRQPTFSLGINNDRIVATTDNALLVFLDGREEPLRLEDDGPIKAAALRPDGEVVASVDTAGRLDLWDLTTLPDKPPSPREIAAGLGKVNDLRWSADGRWLAAGLEDRTARVWPVERILKTGVSYTPVILTHPSGVLPQGSAAEGIAQVAISSDGSRLLAADVNQGGSLVYLWALDKAIPTNLRRYEHAKRVYEVGFSPDASRAFTLSGEGAFLWDATERASDDTSLEEPVMTFLALSSLASVLKFSPDNNHIFVGFNDGQGRMYSTGEDAGELVLAAARKGVWDAAFSPDGRYLATASSDGVVRLWWLDADGRPNLFDYLPHEKGVWTVSFDASGESLRAVSVDGVARIWPFRLDRLVEPNVVRDWLVKANTDCLPADARGRYLGENWARAIENFEECERQNNRDPNLSRRATPRLRPGKP